MKQIRFIQQDTKQIGIDVWKNIYWTEVVEVSDRAYELLTGRLGKESGRTGTFIGAEPVDESPEAQQ